MYAFSIKTNILNKIDIKNGSPNKKHISVIVLTAEKNTINLLLNIYDLVLCVE